MLYRVSIDPFHQPWSPGHFAGHLFEGQRHPSGPESETRFIKNHLGQHVHSRPGIQQTPLHSPCHLRGERIALLEAILEGGRDRQTCDYIRIWQWQKGLRPYMGMISSGEKQPETRDFYFHPFSRSKASGAVLSNCSSDQLHVVIGDQIPAVGRAGRWPRYFF